MTVPIAEGVHVALSGIAQEMAIGAEIQIDMTEAAGRLIASRRFGMEPGVVPFMIRRSYGLGIRMAQLAGHGRTACLHMAGVTDRLEGFVVDHLDSFKLLRISLVLRLLLWGVVAALASFAVNRSLATSAGLDMSTVVRYVAPVIEEVFKSAPLVLLIGRRRFGFLVDAAIGGFAVGAGFAAVENIHDPIAPNE